MYYTFSPSENAARRAGVDGDQPIRLSAAVYAHLRRCLGGRPAEAGALLGSSDGGRTIDTFALDYAAATGSAVYVPNVQHCNRILSQWDDEGILMAGFAHTHPAGATVPSQADLDAAAAYIAAVPGLGGHMEMPILQTEDSPTGFQIHWYTAYPANRGTRIQKRTVMVEGHRVDAPRAEFRRRTQVVPEEELFQRVQGLFPTSIARRKTLVVFGAGGSRPFLTSAARMGIGEYILMDGDRIEPCNLATQGVYADEIGLPKVKATARELLLVDPYCKVRAVKRMLDDSFSDQDFEDLVGPALMERPTDVILCAFTDNFAANARVAALAVKYGTPFLQGLVYRHGTVAEIVFSYPGVTPACPRCCLTSRYEAYAKGQVKQEANVSSDCPISATAILNAYKLEVLQELLFWGEESPYGDRLARHAHTNLLMVRLAEELPPVLQGSAFDRATRDRQGQAVVGGVLWDTIIPDHPRTNGAPACPLCGGTGNLINAVGQPEDTRRTA